MSSLFSDPEMLALVPIMAFYVIFLVVLGTIGIIDYFFTGFGLYGIAKNMRHPSPWLAFIPFARTYLRGSLIAPLSFKKRQLKNPGLWLVLAPIIFCVVCIGIYILLIVWVVFQSIALSSNAYHDGYILSFLPMIILFLLWFILLFAGQAFIYTLTGLVNYRLFKLYNQDNMAVLHMILSLFIPLYQSIYLFTLRNRLPEPFYAPYSPIQPAE